MGLDLKKGNEYMRYSSYSGVHQIRMDIMNTLSSTPTSLNVKRENLYDEKNTLIIKEMYGDAMFNFISHSDCDGTTSNEDLREVADTLETYIEQFDEDMQEWIERLVEFAYVNDAEVEYV